MFASSSILAALASTVARSPGAAAGLAMASAGGSHKSEARSPALLHDASFCDPVVVCVMALPMTAWLWRHWPYTNCMPILWGDAMVSPFYPKILGGAFIMLWLATCIAVQDCFMKTNYMSCKPNICTELGVITTPQAFEVRNVNFGYE